MTAFLKIKMGRWPTNTPAEIHFFEACERGDLEAIRKLIADGVNPKKITNLNSFEETPLHTACK